ncbi:hypothetical protein N7465_004214 [Penicillium sp. CMV-2018d]|nr:hypothetical protein N7465_004214 [Penicillium sp. CMV-2018d]
MAECSKRRYAMKFYIDVLAKLLAVSQQYNSFLSDFLPMAVESPALADALVAWSSGHLSVYDNTYHITALEARATSLRALAKSLTSEDIAISVYGRVLCGPEALKQSPEGRWVLRNFAYHDILGSVTLRKPPLIPGNYLEEITDVVETYIGVGSEILIFISEVSCHHTSSLAHGYLSSDEENPDTTNSWSAIEQKIKNWRCPPGTLQALESLAYAYRCAALIHLYRQTLRSLKLVHDDTHWEKHENPTFAMYSKIEVEVSTTLQYVANIPLNDVPESALLCPLFLVGAEATYSSHMDTIRIRLSLMAKKRNFQNIQRALGVLEEIWERRAQGFGNNQVDGQDIVGQQSDDLLSRHQLG